MKKIVLIIAILLGTARMADALTCPETSLARDFIFSDYIFIGEVVEAGEVESGGYFSSAIKHVVIQVEKSFKGEMPDRINGLATLYSHDDFGVNQKYLIFSNMHEDKYHFGYCSGKTILYEKITDELEKVEEMKNLITAEVGAKVEGKYDTGVIKRVNKPANYQRYLTYTLTKVSEKMFEYKAFYEDEKLVGHRLLTDMDRENYTKETYNESGERWETVVSNGKYVSTEGYDELGSCIYIATYDDEGEMIYEEGFGHKGNFKFTMPGYEGKWIKLVSGKIFNDTRKNGIGMFERELEILELDPPECATKYHRVEGN